MLSGRDELLQRRLACLFLTEFNYVTLTSVTITQSKVSSTFSTTDLIFYTRQSLECLCAKAPEHEFVQLVVRPPDDCGTH